MKIKRQDITFVVCGRIEKQTHACLVSIRKYFPSSPIILSTWKDCIVDHLDGLYDELILNDFNKVPNIEIKCSVDPSERKINSINLQMYSINNGLKKAKTAYSVRFRTDFILKNANILHIYNKLNSFLNEREKQFQIFSQKVLVSNVYTRDPEKCNGGYTFDVSDIFAFGKTEDLLKRWDGTMIEQKSLEYFNQKTKKNNYNPHNSNSQYTAEQYGVINMLKSSSINISLPQTYMDNSNIEFIKNTYNVFLSNFFIIPLKRLGISSKFNKADKKDPCLLEFSKYLKLYQNKFNPDGFKFKFNLIKEMLMTQLFNKKRKKGKKNMEKIIPIAICPDDNYFIHALGLAISILDNSNKDYFYKFYFCHRNIQNKNLKIIKKNIERYKNSSVSFIDFTQETEKFQTVSYVNSKSMFDRIFLSDVVKEDKLIYLDCDMICVGDLSELFKESIQDKYLGVVQDRWVEDLANKKSSQYIETLEKSGVYKNWNYFLLNFLGLENVTDYFNSGMLLMNLKKIREDRIKEKLIDFIIKNQPTPMPDQDALNFVCKDRVEYLSPRFNFVLSTIKSFPNDKYVLQAIRNPIIIHHKFWNTKDFKTGYNSKYRKYIRKIDKKRYISLVDYKKFKEVSKVLTTPFKFILMWLKAIEDWFVIVIKTIIKFLFKWK